MKTCHTYLDVDGPSLVVDVDPAGVSSIGWALKKLFAFVEHLVEQKYFEFPINKQSVYPEQLIVAKYLLKNYCNGQKI